MLLNKTWCDWSDPLIGLRNQKNSVVIICAICQGYTETALTEGAIDPQEIFLPSKNIFPKNF